MKPAIAIIPLLLASTAAHAEYDGPLKSAALMVVAHAECGVTTDDDVFRQTALRGARESKMADKQAFDFILGMSVAYADLLYRAGAMADFCEALNAGIKGQVQ